MNSCVENFYHCVINGLLIFEISHSFAKVYKTCLFGITFFASKSLEIKKIRVLNPCKKLSFVSLLFEIRYYIFTNLKNKKSKKLTK